MKSIKSMLQSTIALTIIILLLVAGPVSTALADSSGPSNAGAGTNVSGFGTASWSDPNNITLPGGAPYATVVLKKTSLVSNYLQGTQYGFAIPSNAIIFGISVVINRQSDFHNPSIMDNSIHLVKGGTIAGNNYATVTAWPLTFEIATYGGPTDLWGTTWTPADINSSDFGVVLSARRQNNGNNDRTAMVDYMQITVYYSYETSTSVQCGVGIPEVAYGDSLTCVATVTQVTDTNTPTGTVSWATGGSGTFDLNTCVLTEVTVGTSSCSASYNPSAVESGFHLITAMYSGDAYFSPSSSSKYISVIQRPVTVTADPQTKVYGDPDPEFTYQITEGSLVFSDTFTGTLTRDPGEDVSTYPILQGTLALSDNYILTYVGADLTITPRPITVTADAKSKVIGHPDPVLTYKITSGSLAFSDTFSGVLTRVAGESLGTYAIQQGSLALNANYTLTFVGANLTITNQRIYLPIIIR